MSKSPFKFLDSYTKEDKDIFFGRETEIEELYQKVFESKILLVCGVSGTGKSSLIDCGLANKFEDSDWLPVSIRRGRNMVESLVNGLGKVALSKIQSAKKGLTGDQIVKALQSIYLDHFKPIYLIFDQFEELFIFGDREEREEFIQIVKTVVDSDLQCKLLFVMREEYLAGAIEFEREIPTFLTNRLRIEKMTWTNAKQVIEEPCKVHGIEVEDELAETILGKLSPESTEVELTYLQVLLDKMYRLSQLHTPSRPPAGESGHPSQEGSKSASSEAEEFKKSTDHSPLSRGAKGGVFNHALLNQIGDVSDLLGSFLEEQISQLEDPDIGLVILKSFVSIKGTKRQITEEEIIDYSRTFGKEISPDTLKDIIHKFVNLRILRDKDENGRYELRHDGLATKIYEKITLVEKELLEVRQFIDSAYSNFEKRKKLLGVDDLEYIVPYENKLFLNQKLEKFIVTSKREIQKAKRRKRNSAVAATIALFIIMAGFTIWALSEKKKSELNYIKAQANNFNFRAKEVAVNDPTIALRLAEYALSLDTTNEQIQNNLRRIYYDNSFYKIIAKHEEWISSVAFSPDGKTILTGSGDNTARLWDLKGNELQVFWGHENYITAVAFSPDGKTILTGSEDNTARLWDLKGNELQVFWGHENGISSVAFSPDGNTILTGSGDITARLWDLEGNQLQVFKGGEAGVSAVAFSPDGKTILTGSSDYTPRLWDLEGNQLQIFKGHKDWVNSVAFSPDGNTILTGSDDRTARLWDLKGNQLQVFKGHEGSVTSLAFSPDGKMILTGLDDRTSHLWDLKGNELQVFRGHEHTIISIDFSPCGEKILTGSFDMTARLWDLEGNRLQVFKGHESTVMSLAFSPDSNTILTGSYDNTARLWDIYGNLICILYEPDHFSNQVAISPSGKTIITTSLTYKKYRGFTIVYTTPPDKFICIWDLKGNLIKIIKQFNGYESCISSAVFLPDGKRILTGASDKTARLWDLKGNGLQVFIGHESSVTSLAFSPDSNTILTGSDDKTARLWDLKGNELQVFKGHEGYISSVAFSPDGKRILTGASDKTARLWNLEGNELQVFKGHESYINLAAFSSDGKTILTGSGDNTARLWDLEGNGLQVFKGHESSVTSLAFSPDGNTILTGSDDNTARLWDIKPMLEKFQKLNNYENLSVSQKIEYGIFDK
ncbi:Tol-Pal system protein TolB [subsurface metagenome]